MGMAGAGAGFQMIGSGIGAYGQYEAGRFNRSMAYYDASLLEMQAADAVARGEEQVGETYREGAQVLGEQRAQLAAQGIDVNDGSALDVQESSAVLVQQDVDTIRNNARREAWGFRQNAKGERMRGRMAYRQGVFGAAGTLLSGGSQAFSAARR